MKLYKSIFIMDNTKKYDSKFNLNKTKKGMALPTAICLTAAILIITFALISITAFNINNTSGDVLGRQAYLSVKSALAYAESYFSDNNVPGLTDLENDGAYIVFDGEVEDGAEIYLAKGMDQNIASYKKASNGTTLVQSEMEDILDNASTHVKAAYVKGKNGVISTKDSFRLTGYSSYNVLISSQGEKTDKLTLVYAVKDGKIIPAVDDNDEVDIQVEEEYKYVNIHVKPYNNTGLEPYIYTWTGGNTNPARVLGGNTFSNIKLSGEWIDEYKNGQTKQIEDTNGNKVWVFENAGPQGSMQYEGNGWYIYTVMVPKVSSGDSGTREYPNNIQAVVTKRDGARDWKIDANGVVTSLGSSPSTEGQTAEIFGIPLPEMAGYENIGDVYITLNKEKFVDFPYNDPKMLTDDIYKEKIKDTVTLYQKKQNTTVHFRTALQTDDNKTLAQPYIWIRKCTKKGNTYTVGGYEVKGEPMEYEGYGWYRHPGVESSDLLQIKIAIGSNNEDDAVLVTTSDNNNIVIGDKINEGENSKEAGRAVFLTAWPNKDGKSILLDRKSGLGITSFANESAANRHFTEGISVTINGEKYENKDIEAANYTTVYARGVNQNLNSQGDNHKVTIDYSTVKLGDKSGEELSEPVTARVKLSVLNNGSDKSVEDGTLITLVYMNSDVEPKTVRSENGYAVFEDLKITGKYYFYVDKEENDENNTYYTTEKSNNVFFTVVKRGNDGYVNYLSDYDGGKVANKTESEQVPYNLIKRSVISVNLNAEGASSLEGAKFEVLANGEKTNITTNKQGTAEYITKSLNTKYTITQFSYLSNDYYANTDEYTFYIDDEGYITNASETVVVGEPKNTAKIDVTNVSQKAIDIQFTDKDGSNIESAFEGTMLVDYTPENIYAKKDFESSTVDLKAELKIIGKHTIQIGQLKTSEYMVSPSVYTINIDETGVITADGKGVTVEKDNNGYTIKIKLVKKPVVKIQNLDADGKLITADGAEFTIDGKNVTLINGMSEDITVGDNETLTAGTSFSFSVKQTKAPKGSVISAAERTFTVSADEDFNVIIKADNENDKIVSISDNVITYRNKSTDKFEFYTYSGKTTTPLANVKVNVTDPLGNITEYNSNESGSITMSLHTNGKYTFENIAVPDGYYVNKVESQGKFTLTVDDSGITSNSTNYQDGVLSMYIAPFAQTSVELDGVFSSEDYVNVTKGDITYTVSEDGELQRVILYSKDKLLNNVLNTAARNENIYLAKHVSLFKTGITETGAVGSGTVCFDNSITKWDKVYFIVGHNNYVHSYEMKQSLTNKNYFEHFLEGYSTSTTYYFANNDGGVTVGASKSISTVLPGITARTADQASYIENDVFFPNASSGMSISGELINPTTLEAKVPADVLSGTHAMFYAGEPISWNQSKIYVRPLNPTSDEALYIADVIAGFKTGTRWYAPAVAPINARYNLSHESKLSAWAGMTMSGNVKAGTDYYINNVNNVNTITVSDGAAISKTQVLNFDGTEIVDNKIEEETPSITLISTATAVQSSGKKAQRVLYFDAKTKKLLSVGSSVSSTDKKSTASIDTSDFKTGEYNIVPVLYDGYIFVKGDNVNLTVTPSTKEPEVKVNTPSQVFKDTLTVSLTKTGNKAASYSINGGNFIDITDKKLDIIISDGMQEGATKLLTVRYVDLNDIEHIKEYIYSKAAKKIETRDDVTIYFTKPYNWSGAYLWINDGSGNRPTNWPDPTNWNPAPQMTKTSYTYTVNGVALDVYSYTFTKAEAQSVPFLMFRGSSSSWDEQTKGGINLVGTGNSISGLNGKIFVVGSDFTSSSSAKNTVTGSWGNYDKHISTTTKYIGVGLYAVKTSAEDLSKSYSPATAVVGDKIDIYAVSKILSDSYTVTLKRDGINIGDVTDLFVKDNNDNDKGTYSWFPSVKGEYTFTVKNANGDTNQITINVTQTQPPKGRNMYTFKAPLLGTYTANVEITDGNLYFVNVSDINKGNINKAYQQFTVIDNGDGTTSVNVNGKFVDYDPNILFEAIKLSDDSTKEVVIQSSSKQPEFKDEAEKNVEETSASSKKASKKSGNKNPVIDLDKLEYFKPIKLNTVTAFSSSIAAQSEKLKNMLESGSDSAQVIEAEQIEVAFLNQVLANSGAKSFTPWSSVYVNWVGSESVADGYAKAQLRTIQENKTLMNCYFASVPADCSSIYFSDNPGTSSGSIKRTVTLNSSTFNTISVSGGTKAPTFFPKSTDSNGYILCGTPTEFITNENTVDTMVFESIGNEMVAVDSNKKIYYNTPLVDGIVSQILLENPNYSNNTFIINASTSNKYSEIYMGTQPMTSKKVFYNGVQYSYCAVGTNAIPTVSVGSVGVTSKAFTKEANKSCLIYAGTGGYSFIESGNYSATDGTKKDTKNDRVGSSYSPEDVNSWYTYKIPTSSASAFTVKGLDGNKSYSSDKQTYPVTGVEKTKVDADEKSKDDQYLNNPIYITLNDSNKYEDNYYSDISVYTYNPEDANVNADKYGNKKVYFLNNEKWDDIYVYYWGIDTNTVSWPGVKMTADELANKTKYYKDSTGKEHAVNVKGYSCDIPNTAAFMIINNGKMQDDPLSEKTETLWFTGKESSYTHEQEVMYDSTESIKKLSMYTNQKTRLTYALNYALGLYNRSTIYTNYTDYNTPNQSTKTYLKLYYQMYDTALDVYKNPSSTADDMYNQTAALLNYGAAYEELLAAVRQARIYLDGTYQNDAKTSKYVFPEGQTKPEGLTYTEYSILKIRSSYNNALRYFTGTSSLTNQEKQVYTIRSVAQKLTSEIAARTVEGTDVIQLQIKNAAEAEWDEETIELYLGPDEADKSTARKYRTTLGNYIYLSVPRSSVNQVHFKAKNITGEDVSSDILTASQIDLAKTGNLIWIYDALSKTWYEKKSDVQHIKYSIIDEKDKSSMGSNVYEFTRKNDNEFSLYFNYNLVVKPTVGDPYMIYSGLYNLKNTEFWDKGIDLFSDKAKDYFTNKVNYGLDQETLSNNVYTASEKELGLLQTQLGFGTKTDGLFKGSSLSTNWIDYHDVLIKDLPEATKQLTKTMDKIVNFHVGKYYYEDGKSTLYVEIPLGFLYETDGNGKVILDGAGNPKFCDKVKEAGGHYFITCKMSAGTQGGDTGKAPFDKYIFSGGGNSPVNIGAEMELFRIDVANSKVIYKFDYDVDTYEQLQFYCVIDDANKTGGGIQYWRTQDYNIKGQLISDGATTSKDLDGKVITLSGPESDGSNTTEFKNAVVNKGNEYGDSSKKDEDGKLTNHYPAGKTYDGGFAPVYEVGEDGYDKGVSELERIGKPLKKNGKINFRFAYNTAIDCSDMNPEGPSGNSAGISFISNEVTFACNQLTGTSEKKSIDITSGKLTGNQHFYIYAEKIKFLTNTKVYYYDYNAKGCKTFTYQAGEYKIETNKDTNIRGIDLFNPTETLQALELVSDKKTLDGGVYLR